MANVWSRVVKDWARDALIPPDIRHWLPVKNHMAQNTQFMIRGNWMYESDCSRMSRRAHETSQHSSEQYGSWVEPSPFAEMHELL